MARTKKTTNEPQRTAAAADSPQEAGGRELQARLWAAANALRGPVDPADFKTYVFPMLFWKWVSDTWLWERARAVAQFGEGVDAEVEADFHRFNIPPGTRWDQVTIKTANIGAAVTKALGKIEQANPDTPDPTRS